MNGFDAIEPSWTRQRWLVTIAILFLAHFLLAFSLGQRRPVTRTANEELVHFRYLGRDASDAFLARHIPAADPSLFVMPNASGFSGEAWMRVPSNEYALPHWEPPVASLSGGDIDFGGSVAAAIQRVASEPPRVAEKAIGPLARVQFLPAEDPPPSVSSFEIERLPRGARLATEPPALPSWTHTEPLAPSILELGVDETGLVHVARLLSRSGLPAADAAALRWGGDLRFEPVRPANGDLNWRQITVHWFTLPVIVTNNPAPVNPSTP